MPFVDVRDTRLYYEMDGEGEPALVMVHGMCAGAWSWSDQKQRLSPEFTCVAYDRRGHSRSEQGTEDQSDRTHAEDLAALIDALGLDPPVLVGSSGGAVVATTFLHLYPDIARGAVLMEPPLFSLDPETGQELVGEVVPKINSAMNEGGERAAVDAFFQTLCSTYWEQAEESRKEQTRANAQLLLPTLQRESEDIQGEDLEKIDVPVLVIGGTLSPPVHRSLNRTLADHLPDARLVEIEGSGHVVFAEKPAEFAREVRTFAHDIARVAPRMA